MFELGSPVWVKGAVVNFEAKNPHVMLELESTSTNGNKQRLLIEGPNLNRFFNMMKADEKFLKVGDTIEVCGFPFKRDVQANAATNNKTLPAYHAQVVVMPDGKMRLYGPYGKLENCIRANDKPQVWADFVNNDPLAQPAWCNSKTFAAFPSLAPPGFIEEVNRRLTTACR
jgi:hypothetical protein